MPFFEKTIESPSVYTDEQIGDEAFKHFRDSGFPYPKLPLHMCMQSINRLAATPTNALMRSVEAYKVADTYHSHRFHATAEGMRSPYDSYQDDTALRKAIRMELTASGVGKDYFGFLSLVNGTHACSNFRPAFALFMYREFCNQKSVILDTSTGYGGRLVGFIASKCARYVGIDPNVPTHEANTRMASDLGAADRVSLINKPAEDVKPAWLADRCDFAFTSPPYFRKEHYSDDPTQSWVRYGSSREWVMGFLLPMMRLQFIALKSGSYAVVNIADVKIKGKEYPLVDWTKKAGEKVGFKHTGVRHLQFFGGSKVRSKPDGFVSQEPVLIFKKER